MLLNGATTSAQFFCSVDAKSKRQLLQEHNQINFQCNNSRTLPGTEVLTTSEHTTSQLWTVQISFDFSKR
jgi:hypothetical protein